MVREEGTQYCVSSIWQLDRARLVRNSLVEISDHVRGNHDGNERENILCCAVHEVASTSVDLAPCTTAGRRDGATDLAVVGRHYLGCLPGEFRGPD